MCSAAVWNKSYLKSLYRGQSIKKCFSFSTTFLLQNRQVLSSYGTGGLEYLPVSTANGNAPARNRANVRLWNLGILHLIYGSSLQSDLYWRYVRSLFPHIWLFRSLNNSWCHSWLSSTLKFDSICFMTCFWDNCRLVTRSRPFTEFIILRTFAFHPFLLVSAHRNILLWILPSCIRKILLYRRTDAILCFVLHDVHPMSPRVAVFEVYFPTPKKYLHALFCTALITLYCLVPQTLLP